MGESEVGESPNSRSWLERVAQVFSGEPTSRNELRAIIQDAADRALLDAEALGIIDGAMAVSEMQARDIMVPRASVVFVRAEESPEEFLPTVIESQHSRFPVIGEDFDDVRGVLHAKDLLPLALTRNLEQFRLKDLIRQAPIIPEAKRLNVLLTEFRENRNHMAIVVDEYGSVAGVVTIEDVLEQIVGEIEDEHDDAPEEWIVDIGEGMWDCDARAELEDVAKHVSPALAEVEESVDTLGGLAFVLAEQVPEVGRVLEHRSGWRIEVTDGDETHVTRLRLHAPEEIAATA